MVESAHSPEPGRLPVRTILLTVSLTVLAALTFAPLAGIRFANADDIAYASLYGFADYWTVYLPAGVASGRFYNLLSCLPYPIHHLIWESDLYDLFLFGTTALAVVALAVAVARLTRNRPVAVLFATLAFAFFSIYDRYNANISYPAFFSAYMAAFAWAICLLHDVIARPSALRGIGATLLLFLALLSHEMLAAIFVAIAGFAAFVWVNGRAVPARPCLVHRGYLPVVAAAAVYFAAYLAFRAAHPSSYLGTQLPALSLGFVAGWWGAFKHFLALSLPLALALEDQVLPRFDGWDARYILEFAYPSLTMALDQASVAGVARSLMVALATFLAMGLAAGRSFARSALGLLAIGIVTLVVPCAMIAASPPYQGYVQGGWSPIHFVYVSGFGGVLILAVGLAWAGQAFRRRPVLRYAVRTGLAGAVGLAALVVDVSNRSVGGYYQRNTEKWLAASVAVRSAVFAEVPGRITLVAPQLYESYLWSNIGATYWSEFFSRRTGRPITVSQTWPAPDAGTSVYFLGFTCPARDSCRVFLSAVDRADGRTASHLTVLSPTDRAQRLFYLDDGVLKGAFLEKTPSISALVDNTPGILTDESRASPNNVVWQASGAMFRGDIAGTRIDPRMVLVP